MLYYMEYTAQARRLSGEAWNNRFGVQNSQLVIVTFQAINHFFDSIQEPQSNVGWSFCFLQVGICC